MTVQEQRDALLDDLTPHAPGCAWDGREPIYGCTCGADERRERLAAVLDSLIAAVRAEEADRLLALEAARDEWQTSSGYWSARTGEVMAANRALITDRDHLAAEVERLRLALRHILAWADLQPSGWVDFIANECHQHLDGEPARALLAGEEGR